MKKRAILAVLVALLLSLALVAPVLVGASPGPGIVGLWHLDEVDTSVSPYTTPDSSGLGNTGSLYPIGSQPTLVAGKFGKALSFDGTDDYVGVANSPSLNFGTGDFTIEAWIKLTTTSHPGQYYGIFDKGQVTLTTEGRYSLFITPSNKLRLHIGHPSSGLFWRDSTLTISDTNWHYIAVSVNRDGNAIFALDSTIETADVFASSSYDTSSTTSATIGVRVDVAKWWFNGLIDEVRIWDEALTAEDIAHNYGLADVAIDIKPGSDPNCFNSNGHGVIPVAILGSPDFDASTVDPFSVALDGAEVRVKGKSGNAGSLEDVNADGDLDLVVQIIDESVYTGDTTAILTGSTYGGMPIEGSDSVCIVPPE